MATESGTTIDDLVEQARGMMAMTPMLAPQMERFWKMQDNLLDEVETFSRGWFERRHEAARSALDTVRRTTGTDADPSGAMRAVAEWQQYALQRLVADVEQWIGLWSRCGARVSELEMQAGKDGLGEVEKRARSVAGQKHSTPV